MVLLERIELSTSPLPRECSTSELQQHSVRALTYWNAGNLQDAESVKSWGCFARYLRLGCLDLPAGDRLHGSDTEFGKREAAQARKARLAEELRQNLKRRKSQTRKRKVASDVDATRFRPKRRDDKRSDDAPDKDER